MDGWVETWHQHLRGTPLRRAATDAAAVAAVGLIALSIGLGPVLSDAPVSGAPGWWHVPPLAVGCLVMLGKNRHPVVMLALGALIFTADLAVGGSLGVMLVLIDLLYTLALVGSERALRRLLTATAMVIAGATVLTWALALDLRVGLFVGLQAFAVLATPIWWGTSVRRQAQLAALASARADDHARLAQLQQEEALRDERERMARDLHDAVAGNLSAIALHTEAALVRTGADPATRRALEATRASSLSALSEMRTMIRLLRGGEPERAATRISDAQAVRELVAAHHGTLRCADLPELPTAVDQTAFRLLQESLTNATKHGDQPPEVRVRTTQAHLHVEVRNAVGTAERPGCGLGLDIMTERAHAVGGICTAGLDGGTWTVQARLPLTQEAP